jgi:hypothetical protein
MLDFFFNTLFQPDRLDPIDSSQDGSASASYGDCDLRFAGAIESHQRDASEFARWVGLIQKRQQKLALICDHSHPFRGSFWIIEDSSKMQVRCGGSQFRMPSLMPQSVATHVSGLV